MSSVVVKISLSLGFRLWQCQITGQIRRHEVVRNQPQRHTAGKPIVFAIFEAARVRVLGWHDPYLATRLG